MSFCNRSSNLTKAVLSFCHHLPASASALTRLGSSRHVSMFIAIFSFILSICCLCMVDTEWCRSPNNSYSLRSPPWSFLLCATLLLLPTSKSFAHDTEELESENALRNGKENHNDIGLVVPFFLYWTCCFRNAKSFHMFLCCVLKNPEPSCSYQSAGKLWMISKKIQMTSLGATMVAMDTCKPASLMTEICSTEFGLASSESCRLQESVG